MKKKPIKKKVVKKKVSKTKLNKLSIVLERKLKSKLTKARRGVKARNDYDPYAPETWDVDYMVDEKGKVSAHFFRLTAREQTKNRKHLEDIRKQLTEVELHAETVQEAIDQMKFQK